MDTNSTTPVARQNSDLLLNHPNGILARHRHEIDATRATFNRV